MIIPLERKKKIIFILYSSVSTIFTFSPNTFSLGLKLHTTFRCSVPASNKHWTLTQSVRIWCFFFGLLCCVETTRIVYKYCVNAYTLLNIFGMISKHSIQLKAQKKTVMKNKTFFLSFCCCSLFIFFFFLFFIAYRLLLFAFNFCSAQMCVCAVLFLNNLYRIGWCVGSC